MRNACIMGLAAAGILAAVGCGADARYPGSRPAPDDSAAIGRIAFTRLAREQACRPVADVDARLSALRAATEAELEPASCKSNVHPRQLDACVAAIEHWPCDVALQRVTAIATCQAAPLCGVPTTEGTL